MRSGFMVYVLAMTGADCRRYVPRCNFTPPILGGATDGTSALTVFGIGISDLGAPLALDDYSLGAFLH
jgi:hypothetical protein